MAVCPEQVVCEEKDCLIISALSGYDEQNPDEVARLFYFERDYRNLVYYFVDEIFSNADRRYGFITYAAVITLK